MQLSIARETINVLSFNIWGIKTLVLKIAVIWNRTSTVIHIASDLFDFMQILFEENIPNRPNPVQ